MSRRAKMLVHADGTQSGTVGGGCLEAEVHAMSRLAIRSGQACFERFTLTESKAGAEGLNCGGTVRMLIEPIDPASAGAAAIYREAIQVIERREEAVLATVLEETAGTDPVSGPRTVRILGKGLVRWKGVQGGQGVLGPESAPGPLVEQALEEARSILGQDRSKLVSPPEPSGRSHPLIFLESVSVPPMLYLCGGGHVSLAIAQVAHTAGFRVVVIDDRPAFANPERFPDADRTLARPMATALEGLPIDGNSYIAAVTRGHQYDEPIVEQAIRTRACYIGMIGSRRKVAILWDRLKQRGAREEDLARVHAPIGLSIGAESPGEIAVSILAQMIAVRRGEPPP